MLGNLSFRILRIVGYADPSAEADQVRSGRFCLRVLKIYNKSVTTNTLSRCALNVNV